MCWKPARVSCFSPSNQHVFQASAQFSILATRISLSSGKDAAQHSEFATPGSYVTSDWRQTLHRGNISRKERVFRIKKRKKIQVSKRNNRQSAASPPGPQGVYRPIHLSTDPSENQNSGTSQQQWHQLINTGQKTKNKICIIHWLCKSIKKWASCKTLYLSVSRLLNKLFSSANRLLTTHCINTLVLWHFL